MILHQLEQIGAFHVLHGNETIVAHLIEVMDHNYVGMRKLGGRFRFSAKATNRFRILPIMTNDLESDNSVESLLNGLVDVSHASLAQGGQDRIARNRRCGRGLRGIRRPPGDGRIAL